jgi:hypothetical protein
MQVAGGQEFPSEIFLFCDWSREDTKIVNNFRISAWLKPSPSPSWASDIRKLICWWKKHRRILWDIIHPPPHLPPHRATEEPTSTGRSRTEWQCRVPIELNIMKLVSNDLAPQRPSLATLDSLVSRQNLPRAKTWQRSSRSLPIIVLGDDGNQRRECYCKQSRMLHGCRSQHMGLVDQYWMPAFHSGRDSTDGIVWRITKGVGPFVDKDAQINKYDRELPRCRWLASMIITNL